MPRIPNAHLELVCHHCHVAFHVTPFEFSQRKCCSKQCRQAQKQKVALHCKLCGQEFFVHHYRADTAKYCSMDCSWRGLIWNKIDTSGGVDSCWEFQGDRTEKGYGKKIRHGHYTSVHRFIYTETYGPIPEDKQINHRCNNPPCCNPRHLYAGTQKENIEDAKKRGTLQHGFKPGELHPIAKLSNNQVREIWQSKGHINAATCAERFGVKPMTIYSIWARRSWKHITQDF